MANNFNNFNHYEPPNENSSFHPSNYNSQSNDGNAAGNAAGNANNLSVPQSKLENAIIEENFDEVVRLVNEDHVDFQELTSNGINTPLGLAVGFVDHTRKVSDNIVKIVNFLLDVGANPNGGEYKPLLSSLIPYGIDSEKANLDIVEKLLKKEAYPIVSYNNDFQNLNSLDLMVNQINMRTGDDRAEALRIFKTYFLPVAHLTNIGTTISETETIWNPRNIVRRARNNEFGNNVKSAIMNAYNDQMRRIEPFPMNNGAGAGAGARKYRKNTRKHRRLRGRHATKFAKRK